MRTKTQEQIIVELGVKDDAPEWIKEGYPRTIVMKDYVADAFRKLLDAGDWGVHRSEFRKDAFTRLDQLGIGYTRFRNAKMEDGWKRDWLKLALPHWMTARIVGEAA